MLTITTNNYHSMLLIIPNNEHNIPNNNHEFKFFLAFQKIKTQYLIKLINDFLSYKMFYLMLFLAFRRLPSLKIF